MTTQFKTVKENFLETLEEARQLSAKEIREILRDRFALHSWAVEAYEQALKEKKASSRTSI